jgi:DNA-binding transcriptional MerR regulator
MTIHNDEAETSEGGAEEAVSASSQGRSQFSDSTGDQKSASAFRTISEAADIVGVQQHVLRFWETRFSQVRPLKRGGGRRYYRPEDISLLKRIYHLLYSEGYTIKGAQKLLKGKSKAQILNDGVQTGGAANQGQPTVIKQGLGTHQREILESTLSELRELRSWFSH